jgi:hypothetical protein
MQQRTPAFPDREELTTAMRDKLRAMAIEAPARTEVLGQMPTRPARTATAGDLRIFSKC